MSFDCNFPTLNVEPDAVVSTTRTGLLFKSLPLVVVRHSNSVRLSTNVVVVFLGGVSSSEATDGLAAAFHDIDTDDNEADGGHKARREERHGWRQ
jgi:hypothetical protein